VPAIPTGINVIRAERVVEVTWEPGHVGRYPIRDLRLACNCAVCVDEFTGVRRLDPRSVPDDIGITGAQPVGNYAVKFVFSDGHDTGLYTFETLARLCPCDRCAAAR